MIDPAKHEKGKALIDENWHPAGYILPIVEDRKRGEGGGGGHNVGVQVVAISHEDA